MLVWVALGVLHGCRANIFESRSLPAAVKAVRRHAEGCRSFDELIRQAPVGLNQVRALRGRRVGAGKGGEAEVERWVLGQGGGVMIGPRGERSGERGARRRRGGVICASVLYAAWRISMLKV